MRISSIKIENFRAYEEQELSFDSTAVQYSFFLIRFSMWDKGFTF
jgi:AAA15 family ATPase/GTPase